MESHSLTVIPLSSIAEEFVPEDLRDRFLTITNNWWPTLTACEYVLVAGLSVLTLLEKFLADNDHYMSHPDKAVFWDWLGDNEFVAVDR